MPCHFITMGVNHFLSGMISYRVLTCKIKFGYQRVLGFGMHPDIDVRLFFHQLHPKGDWAITRSVAERNLRYLSDVVIFVVWSIYVHISINQKFWVMWVQNGSNRESMKAGRC